MDPVAFINKWVHLASVIGTVGGIFLMRWVVVPGLDPAALELEPAKGIVRRFGMAMGILWLLVLMSGFLNMYLVSPHVNKSYQMFLGIKTLLALVMFALSMAVSHPAPMFAGVRRSAGQWLAVISILALIVIGLSAHLNLSRIDGSGLRSSSSGVV